MDKLTIKQIAREYNTSEIVIKKQIVQIINRLGHQFGELLSQFLNIKKFKYLNEKSYNEIINNYNIENWQPFLEIIPILEDAYKGYNRFINLGKMVSIEFDKNTDKIIKSFLDICYSIPIILIFDWVTWIEENPKIKNYKLNFDALDIPTKCKLLSSIICNEKFQNGYIKKSIYNGYLLKITRSIATLIQNENSVKSL